MIFRKKLRYILVEASSELNMRNIALADKLKTEMRTFLGELTYFKTNPQIATQMNPKVFIINTNRGYERNAILALSFIKNVNGKNGFYTIKISGTIRALKNQFRKIYGKS